MSDTYRNVDAADDIDEAIEWQERIDEWPSIAAYKDSMDQLAGQGRPILDVGTGPGLDAERVGAIGLDASIAMAARARSRGVPVMVGDGHHLPIPDATFAVVRADRVLQHLDDPAAALAELERVLLPGGRLVVADPDQQTLSISVPGVPDRLTSTVRRLRRDVGYRNGRFASTVAGTLTSLGLEQVAVHASALVLTDPALAFGLPGWVTKWREEGGFSDADDRLWRTQLAATTNAGFVYTVTYLVTAATKPPVRGG